MSEDDDFSIFKALMVSLMCSAGCWIFYLILLKIRHDAIGEKIFICLFIAMFGILGALSLFVLILSLFIFIKDMFIKDKS